MQWHWKKHMQQETTACGTNYEWLHLNIFICIPTHKSSLLIVTFVLLSVNVIIFNVPWFKIFVLAKGSKYRVPGWKWVPNGRYMLSIIFRSIWLLSFPTSCLLFRSRSLLPRRNYMWRCIRIMQRRNRKSKDLHKNFCH